MEGLTAVQSRISEIQSRMASFAAGGPNAAWLSAASAAGLTTSATTASSATTAAVGTSAETSVVQAAQNYLGVPYLWGGTDPTKGLDCSGFTQRVYADLGISIPRTSSQQATAGTAVASLADARPGDLVFFDNSSARAGIDHVGIYLGNGKMIAAPQEGDVVKVQDVGTPTVIRRILPTTTATTSSSSAGGGLSGVPYSDLFTAAAAKYGVSASVLAGMAKVESGFDTTAVSGAGAQGLMQFMPSTAAGLGVNPLDPASAIDGAAKYLSQLTARFGSTDLALAAYNAGPGAVASAGGIPPYPETQNYVRKVTAAAAAYA
ncbi:Cell wall-associated hydrolase, NlpC family [Klenkia soli]|uniref:Cell wall-associated hydrolase, NlpC family n=1 Tax=Klenkia soli TaxID=1052260 RepID=A0A1H0CM61_9ACTN|nr:NlpC/P60 family protein [Klenkia soli]SDN58932.1 Cell wall-associated hydrolase, NlpC family [Klenkia soli]